MKKILAVLQNEGAVIRHDDTNFIGLVTHSIQSCVGVIISDKENGIFALQHHDSCTKPEEILRTINSHSFKSPEVILVINENFMKKLKDPQHGSLYNKNVVKNEGRQGLPVIRHILDKHQIPYKIEATYESNEYSHYGANTGFFLSKEGEIDLKKSVYHQDYGYTRLSGFGTWPTFEDRHKTVLVQENEEKRMVLANTTIFGEKLPLFTIYDGDISKTSEIPTLSNISETYIKGLVEKNILTQHEIDKELSADLDKGRFDRSAAGHIFPNRELIARNVEFIIANNLFTNFLNCPPPPDYIIEGGTTIVPENDKYQSLLEKRAQNDCNQRQI